MNRRWFQVHLSTTVVLMFVASGLLGMNLVSRDFYFSDFRDPFMPMEEQEFNTERTEGARRISITGWPWLYSRRLDFGDGDSDNSLEIVGLGNALGSSEELSSGHYVFNIGACALVCLMAGVTFESYIRRRVRSHLPEEPR